MSLGMMGVGGGDGVPRSVEEEGGDSKIEGSTTVHLRPFRQLYASPSSFKNFGKVPGVLTLIGVD